MNLEPHGYRDRCLVVRLRTIPPLLGETKTAWEAVLGICRGGKGPQGRASGRERVSAGVRAYVNLSRRAIYIPSPGSPAWRFSKTIPLRQPLAPSPPRFSGGEGWGEVVLIKTSENSYQSSCAVPHLGLRGQAQRDPAFRPITRPPANLTHHRPLPAQTVHPDLRSSRRQKAHFNLPARSFQSPASITHHRPCAVPHLGLRRQPVLRSVSGGGNASVDGAFRPKAVQPAHLVPRPKA